MDSEQFRSDQGAPLRVFLLAISFWVFCRLLWASWAATGFQPSVSIASDVMARQLKSQHQPKVAATRKADFHANIHYNDIRLQLGSSQASSTLFRIPIKIESDRIPIPFLGDDAQLVRTAIPNQWTNIAIKDAYTPEKRSRWSSYFWLHTRENTGNTSSNFGQLSQPIYGGSQAGARLSYRLSHDNQKYVGLYARASTAIAAPGQEELAIGITLQPLNTKEISVNIEHRERKDGQSSNSAFLVYNPNPKPIAINTRLETYIAAGYVSGGKEQYFADGYAAIQKTALEARDGNLSVGGGIWAATQKNVSRVDIGPSANINLHIGGMPSRIAIDWRQRIAGNAAPGSGLALTFSTGF